MNLDDVTNIHFSINLPDKYISLVDTITSLLTADTHGGETYSLSLTVLGKKLTLTNISGKLGVYLTDDEMLFHFNGSRLNPNCSHKTVIEVIIMDLLCKLPTDLIDKIDKALYGYKMYNGTLSNSF